MYYRMTRQISTSQRTAPVGTIFWFEEEHIRKNASREEEAVTINFKFKTSESEYDGSRCYSMRNFVECLFVDEAIEDFNVL